MKTHTLAILILIAGCGPTHQPTSPPTRPEPPQQAPTEPYTEELRKADKLNQDAFWGQWTYRIGGEDRRLDCMGAHQRYADWATWPPDELLFRSQGWHNVHKGQLVLHPTWLKGFRRDPKKPHDGPPEIRFDILRVEKDQILLKTTGPNPETLTLKRYEEK